MNTCGIKNVEELIAFAQDLMRTYGLGVSAYNAIEDTIYEYEIGVLSAERAASRIVEIVARDETPANRRIRA